MGEEWETDKEESGLSASSKLPGSVQYHLLRGPSRGLAGKRVVGFAESWPQHHKGEQRRMGLRLRDNSLITNTYLRF